MEVANRVESREEYLNYEVALGAKKLIEEIMLVKPGESVLITVDTSSDMRVAEATAQAVYLVGAHPIVLRYETKETSALEPPAPVAAAAAAADVWIEYQLGYIMHSNAFRAAMETGVRYICLTSMDVSMLVNTVARVDYEGATRLGRRMVELMTDAQEIHITNPAGTDIVGTRGDRPINLRGLPATEPGASVMLSGQISFNPLEESQNGVFVFDGATWPPNELGLLHSSIRLEVRNGVITDISGDGNDARVFKTWMASHDDPNMYRIAHWSLGFNPGVRHLTGRIVEDERVFGCVEIGMGTKGAWIGGEPWIAAAHTDSSMLAPSIYLDGEPLEIEGRYVEPSVAQICHEMGVEGY